MAALLAFVGATAVGGYCGMAAASTPLGVDGATPHDCCKTGLSGKVPSCCHVGSAPAHIAVIKSPSAIAQPTVSATAMTLPRPVDRPRLASMRLASLSHGPPLTVLRV